MEKDLEKMYQDKIRRLEEDISGLRMSRRIMMTLLEQTQINGRAEQERLLNENRRLNKQVSAYARQSVSYTHLDVYKRQTLNRNCARNCSTAALMKLLLLQC